MSDYVADSIGDTRFILFVLAAFATASVLLGMLVMYLSRNDLLAMLAGVGAAALLRAAGLG